MIRRQSCLGASLLTGPQSTVAAQAFTYLQRLLGNRRLLKDSANTTDGPALHSDPTATFCWSRIELLWSPLTTGQKRDRIAIRSHQPSPELSHPSSTHHHLREPRAYRPPFEVCLNSRGKDKPCTRRQVPERIALLSPPSFRLFSIFLISPLISHHTNPRDPLLVSPYPTVGAALPHSPLIAARCHAFQHLVGLYRFTPLPSSLAPRAGFYPPSSTSLGRLRLPASPCPPSLSWRASSCPRCSPI